MVQLNRSANRIVALIAIPHPAASRSRVKVGLEVARSQYKFANLASMLERRTAHARRLERRQSCRGIVGATQKSWSTTPAHAHLANDSSSAEKGSVSLPFLPLVLGDPLPGRIRRAV